MQEDDWGTADNEERVVLRLPIDHSSLEDLSDDETNKDYSNCRMRRRLKPNELHLLGPSDHQQSQESSTEWPTYDSAEEHTKLQLPYDGTEQHQKQQQQQQSDDDNGPQTDILSEEEHPEDNEYL